MGSNFYKKLSDKFNNQITTEDDYINGDIKMNFHCIICGETFNMKPRKLIEKSYNSCHICRANKKREDSRNELISLIDPNLYKIIDIPNPVNMNKDKMTLLHLNCGKINEITPSNFKRGRQCPFCSNKPHPKDHKWFLDKINELNPNFINEYELITEYKGYHKEIQLKHNKCGKILKSTPKSLYDGNRCKFCSHRSYKYTIDEVREIIEDDDEFTLVSDQYINNKIPLLIRCNRCMTESRKSLVSFLDDRNRKCSCNINSAPIKYIHEFLNSKKIIFETEKRFDDCRNIRPLPFDIYLNEYNTLIEYDGEQHFHPIYGEEKFMRTQLHDEIKNEFCRENNIKLIRIKYTDNYKDEIEKVVQRLSKRSVI